MNQLTRRLAALVAPVLTLLLALSLTTPVQAAAPAAPVVSWSAGNVVAGTRVVATVRRASKPAGSKLALQRKHLDRWRFVDRTAVRGKRGFVLRVPTGQYGTFTFRVVARKDGRVVTRSAPRQVQVRPPYAPRGQAAQHAFMSSPPTRWNSCQVIRWKYSTAGAPKGMLPQVRRAMTRIQKATGLTLKFAGRTSRRANPFGDRVRGAQVIIGWRGPNYQYFSSNTAAVGGHRYFTGFREADGTAVNKATQGGVTLNRAARGVLSNGFGQGHTWGEVMIHEVADVLGLGHVNAPSQIMNPSTTANNANWGAGDLAGLRRLGDVRGCVTRRAGRVPAEPGYAVLP